jgi:hypothetical protein
VLSRLGADIQKCFQSGDRPLPLTTALNIAIQIIDSLGNANNNTRSGIFKEPMGARNRGGRGLSYRPARLYRLAEFMPWNQFLGSINVSKYGL